LIDQIDAELSNYPDPAGLEKQNENLDILLERIEAEMADVRASVRTLLDDKRQLTSEIGKAERRSVDIGLSLDSFEQLLDVYGSDIARLESIEEAGFRGGPGCLNRFSASISGASAGVRLPSGLAAG